MNNPKNTKNTLLLNGPEEIAALSDLWLELEKQDWKFTSLNSKSKSTKHILNPDWHNKPFYPLPRTSSKIKTIFVLILWPFWFLFYLIYLAFYKFRKKINRIICFNISDIFFLTPVTKILRLPTIALLSPRSIRYFIGLKGKGPQIAAAKKNQIIVMGTESKKHLIDLGFIDKNINILHPGIKAKVWQHQSDIFSSLAQADKKRSNKKFFSIGTVVELNKAQNIELLFQAAKKCLTVIPHMQIVIIGDGPERKNLTWLAKKINIANLVWFVGDQKHLKKWLDNIDVYVATCARAGINDMMNTLSAAASALPIISPENIGLNDIIIDNNNGRMIKKDSNEDLTQAIIRLYKDKRERQRLGQAAQKCIEEKFRHEHMLSRFNSIDNNK